jgi:riboflavin synthase
MFSGIVGGRGQIIQVNRSPLDLDLTIKVSGIEGELPEGGSLAVNGVCLTIRRVTPERHVLLSACYETLNLTNLGLLEPFQHVNLEEPLRANGLIGGHFVQGHVDHRTSIVSQQWHGEAVCIRFALCEELGKYIVKKGFVAIDGVSLTVTEKGNTWFEVAMIPHTFSTTIAKAYKSGTVVNVEVDVLGRYVENFLMRQQQNG